LEVEGLGKGKALGKTFILEKLSSAGNLFVWADFKYQQCFSEITYCTFKAPKPLVNYFQLIYWNFHIM